MGDQLAPMPWPTRPVYGASWALFADAVNYFWWVPVVEFAYYKGADQ